jgi:hypothetical protein
VIAFGLFGAAVVWVKIVGSVAHRMLPHERSGTVANVVSVFAHRMRYDFTRSYGRGAYAHHRSSCVQIHGA